RAQSNYGVRATQSPCPGKVRDFPDLWSALGVMPSTRVATYVSCAQLTGVSRPDLCALDTRECKASSFRKRLLTRRPRPSLQPGTSLPSRGLGRRHDLPDVGRHRAEGSVQDTADEVGLAGVRRCGCCDGLPQGCTKQRRAEEEQTASEEEAATAALARQGNGI